MDRNSYYTLMRNSGSSDYEKYLNISKLFASQIDFAELCNGDELQFQVVHQIEELLMKLIGYTLLDIIDSMEVHETNKIITLFKRVHQGQRAMLDILDLLGTMAPKEYQQIRIKLGRGSGRDSPGFKAIMHLFSPLWEAYKRNYVDNNNTTLQEIYDSAFDYTSAYFIAEALLEYEVLFQRFLAQHMQTVNRSIGSEARSLKGNDIQKLHDRMTTKFFPELWKVRSDMTDRWGQEYGYVRDPIK